MPHYLHCYDGDDDGKIIVSLLIVNMEIKK